MLIVKIKLVPKLFEEELGERENHHVKNFEAHSVEMQKQTNSITWFYYIRHRKGALTAHKNQTHLMGGFLVNKLCWPHL